MRGTWADSRKRGRERERAGRERYLHTHKTGDTCLGSVSGLMMLVDQYGIKRSFISIDNFMIVSVQR